MLPAYDAFDVGAFVCSAAVLDAVEEVAARGDTLRRWRAMLASLGTGRGLPLEADEWWSTSTLLPTAAAAAAVCSRSTGKALDGAVRRACCARFRSAS